MIFNKNIVLLACCESNLHVISSLIIKDVKLKVERQVLILDFYQNRLIYIQSEM